MRQIGFRPMRLLLLLVFVLSSSTLEAQTKKQGADEATSFPQELYSDQIELTRYMWKAQRDTSAFGRNDANYLFIRKLVQTLRMEQAYQFPFDSLKAISILESPDKKFKIYSWQVKQDGGTWRHFGCILKNQAVFELYPLIDHSDEMQPGTDTVTDNKHWFGAAYYQFAAEPIKIKGITYYTLIGYDGFEPFSQRKIIDVVWFDKNGQPHFGAPIFSLPGGLFTRVIFEYSKDANMALRWDEANKMIIADHLVPRKEENRGLYFDYVADGSFDGFKLSKNKWTYQDNIDLRMKATPAPTAPKKP